MQFWITIALILVLSALGLTYEIAAGRVLAPFFGTSLLTWTTVIAVVDLPRKSGEHQLRNQEVFYGKRKQADAGISA